MVTPSAFARCRAGAKSNSKVVTGKISQMNGLAEGIKESLVTNEILQVELAKIRTDLAHLKTELIFWVVGTVGLGTILSHFWK
jgi:hypothetical protein